MSQNEVTSEVVVVAAADDDWNGFNNSMAESDDVTTTWNAARKVWHAVSIVGAMPQRTNIA